VNTVANAFDYYGVSREPYIGIPDRAHAPLSPFPGPGGGMGVYVTILSAGYRTDYGHLDLARTAGAVPAEAFAPPYSPSYDSTWRVRRGDVIGYTGDAGYSEAPHLHYQITDRVTGEKLCPTSEPGFDDGGWLSR
jgi:hypothetical protein